MLRNTPKIAMCATRYKDPSISRLLYLFSVSWSHKRHYSDCLWQDACNVICVNEITSTSCGVFESFRVDDDKYVLQILKTKYEPRKCLRVGQLINIVEFVEYLAKRSKLTKKHTHLNIDLLKAP